MQAGAARITQPYRERGYPFASAYLPAQTVDGRLVRVAVLDGKLGKVQIDKASRQREAVVATPLAQLKSGEVMHADARESTVMHAQASPCPGAEPGTSDLVMRVDPQTQAWEPACRI